jgi:hypothetical protein
MDFVSLNQIWNNLEKGKGIPYWIRLTGHIGLAAQLTAKRSLSWGPTDSAHGPATVAKWPGSQQPPSCWAGFAATRGVRELGAARGVVIGEWAAVQTRVHLWDVTHGGVVHRLGMVLGSNSHQRSTTTWRVEFTSTRWRSGEKRRCRVRWWLWDEPAPPREGQNHTVTRGWRCWGVSGIAHWRGKNNDGTGMPRRRSGGWEVPATAREASPRSGGPPRPEHMEAKRPVRVCDGGAVNGEENRGGGGAHRGRKASANGGAWTWGQVPYRHAGHGWLPRTGWDCNTSCYGKLNEVT